MNDEVAEVFENSGETIDRNSDENMFYKFSELGGYIVQSA